MFVNIIPLPYRFSKKSSTTIGFPALSLDILDILSIMDIRPSRETTELFQAYISVWQVKYPLKRGVGCSGPVWEMQKRDLFHVVSLTFFVVISRAVCVPFAPKLASCLRLPGICNLLFCFVSISCCCLVFSAFGFCCYYL